MAPETSRIADRPASIAAAAFVQAFRYPPQRLFQAPGRVNLIGEHTDYNDGFVLPMALDRHICVAAAPRDDRRVRLRAPDLGSGAVSDFGLDDLRPARQKSWSNFARGVLALLDRGGAPLRGIDLVYAGNVPLGAGLSSSAALEVAIATAANDLFDLHLPPLKLAQVCQQAEQEFAGTQCGLMDQLIAVLGQRDRALLIDCRHLTWEEIPLPPDAAVVVCDTGKRRSLTGSAYNERRAQCEEGASRLGVPALRDLSVEAFEARAGDLPPLLRKRCRHVVHENARTQQAARALRRGDVAAFGRLMDESHASLRDLYEVSCDELDLMVALARLQPGCWGARMTGAGFGGCAVALVEREATPAFVARVGQLYERQSQHMPALYVCRAAAGAGPIQSGRE